MIPVPVHEASRHFIDGQPPWHVVLVRSLEERRAGLAFQWLKSCVIALLPLQRSENETDLWCDIETIDAFAASRPSLQELNEKARVIWYRPNRDMAQVAVSKLYAAISAGERKAKLGGDYAASVSVLVDAAPDREAAFKWVVEEYMRIFGEAT